MKITKSQLKRIIKEELQEISLPAKTATQSQRDYEQQLEYARLANLRAAREALKTAPVDEPAVSADQTIINLLTEIRDSLHAIANKNLV
jgi:hypothetical protein